MINSNSRTSQSLNESDFKHKVIVVTIDKSAGLVENPTPIKIYECTRKSWILDPEKANQFDYVIAKINGIAHEIYQPTSGWYQHPQEPDKRRYAFDGDVVTNSEIRELYLNKTINDKSRNPVRYFGENN